MSREKIAKALREHTAVLEESFQGQAGELEEFARKVVDVFHRGGKLLVLGSGAMGAVASHVANLFLHRLALERPVLPSLSLCHDVTLATSLAREGKEKQFFSRQLRAVAAEGDALLAFGDAHRDPGLEEALAEGIQMGCVIALLVSGKENGTDQQVDCLFRLATDSPARAVEGALIFGHLLAEL
ncbi:MAG: SIS domain-containing protein, partial [Desulfuromonadales bacterium]